MAVELEDILQVDVAEHVVQILFINRQAAVGGVGRLLQDGLQRLVYFGGHDARPRHDDLGRPGLADPEYVVQHSALIGIQQAAFVALLYKQDDLFRRVDVGMLPTGRHAQQLQQRSPATVEQGDQRFEQDFRRPAHGQGGQKGQPFRVLDGNGFGQQFPEDHLQDGEKEQHDDRRRPGCCFASNPR